MTTYAINGIGRVGKYVLKFLLKRNLRIKWINDAVGTTKIHRHLLEFDSVHGRWHANFSNDDKTISINNVNLAFTNFSKIEDLDLERMNNGRLSYILLLDYCKKQNSEILSNIEKL